MDDDEARARTGEFFRIGPVEEAAHLYTVERGNLHQFRLHELRGVESACLAFRPAREHASRHLQRPRIRGRARGIEREAEFRVAPPFHIRDHPERELRLREHFSRVGIEDAEDAHSGFVGDTGDLFAVGCEGEIRDVPRDVRREHALGAGRQIETHEPPEFRPLVRDCEKRCIVRGKRTAIPSDLLSAVRGERFGLAGGKIEQMQVAFVCTDRLTEQEFIGIVRPAQHAPATTRDL